MKLGAENKVELVLAVILGLVAILVLGRLLLPDSSQAPAKANATTAQPASAKPLVGDSLDPQLRLDLLKNSEGVRYEGKGRNIFIAGAAPVDIPKPVQNPLQRPGQQQQPSQPPPPPPIDLKFFGFASRPGEPVKAFLSRGENIFVAREGDIVDRQYRVIKIGANSIEIEDVLHNNRQSIPLIRG